jgi:hypothetical protein
MWLGLQTEPGRIVSRRGEVADIRRRREPGRCGIELAAPHDLDETTAPTENAVDTFRAALDERSRLEALQAQLVGRRPELQAAHAAALEEADRAEADQAVEAAGPALEALYGEHVAAAKAAYEEELANAAMQLADVLKKGHAIAATGTLRDHLEGVQIPSFRYAGQPFIRGAAVTIAGETMLLNEAWMEDEAAMAIFSDLQPLRRLTDQLGQHRARAQREAEARRLEQNEQGRERAFARSSGPVPEPRNPAAEDWKPPAGAGPLRSSEVREPGTPVPSSDIAAQLADSVAPAEHERGRWPQSAEAAAKLAGHR